MLDGVRDTRGKRHPAMRRAAMGECEHAWEMDDECIPEPDALKALLSADREIKEKQVSVARSALEGQYLVQDDSARAHFWMSHPSEFGGLCILYPGCPE